MLEHYPLRPGTLSDTPEVASHGRTAIGAVSRLENGWALGPWGFDSLSFRLPPPAGCPPGRRSRPPGRLAPLSAPGSPGLCESTIPSGPARSATRRRREELTEAWPSWQGSALLPRRRRHAARRFESCCLRRTMRRRSIGRTTGCYPEDAGSSPAVAAHTPRSSSGSRMPVSHAGDAGSNPARGSHALGRVWRCGLAVSRVRRVRFPSRALLAELSGRAPRSYRGRRGFDSSRRDCVARLVASPRAVTPTSRVRFPGDAPFLLAKRESAERIPAA